MGSLLHSHGFHRPTLSTNIRAHPQPGLSPGNELRKPMSAKRAAAAQQMNSFQNAGLTAAVVAHEDIQAFAGGAVQRRQDP